APHAGTLDQAAFFGLFLVLGVRLVLRPLEILVLLPARLRAAEGLPVELDLDAFLGEKAFLLGHELVDAHAFRRDSYLAHASSFDWQTIRRRGKKTAPRGAVLAYCGREYPTA